MFGTDPVWTDYAAAMLMQFDPAAIPLLSRAADRSKWPATDAAKSDVSLTVNGNRCDWQDLSRVLERGFVPPKGWIGHVGPGGAAPRPVPG
jgi:hypothetical protein